MHICSSPWNKGRLLGQKPPLKPKEIWSLRIRLKFVESPGLTRQDECGLYEAR